MVAMSEQRGVEKYVMSEVPYKSADFGSFVCGLADDTPPFLLFCDNAPIHRAIVANRRIDLTGTEIAFNLPREPDLNCIEKLFLVLKTAYRK